jgi:hypothetical protein
MTTLRAKSVMFEEEQRAILNKIYEIIGINETKKEFTLYELCSKPDSIKQIVDMKPQILKFFCTGHWICFKEGHKTDNDYIVLIRNIFKTLKVNYTVVSTKIKLEKCHYVNTQLYKLEI